MIDQDHQLKAIEQVDSILAEFRQYFSWPLAHRPKRVVSLVPSITDSLIQLGFGGALVGITNFCPIPPEQRFVQKVGGPANFDIPTILEISPALIIGGLEENPRTELLRLGEQGFPLWVVAPLTVMDTINFLYQIAEGFQSRQAFEQVRSLEVALSYVHSAEWAHPSPIRYFCPIWYEREKGRDSWMVFGEHTYAANLLSLFGAKNCFLIREGGEGNKTNITVGLDRREEKSLPRYYKVSIEEILEANPNLILLPSEPYPFNQSHRAYLEQVLEGVLAVQHGNILLIDGRLIFWYGTCLGSALRELPSRLFGLDYSGL